MNILIPYSVSAAFEKVLFSRVLMRSLLAMRPAVLGRVSRFPCGTIRLNSTTAPINYFSVFSLPQPAMELDVVALQRAYHQLQAAHHPDLQHSGGSRPERSVDVNLAYENLKDPLLRARHILELQGVTLREQQMAPDFLMELMEINESLGNWTEALAKAPVPSQEHAEATKELAAIQSAAAAKEQELKQAVCVAFAAKDTPQMLLNTAKWQYFRNVVRLAREQL